jgi:hypothetical protein
VVTVATGTGSLFPAITGTEFFTATLWAAGSSTGVPNEIVRVTARSGDTMTVVRAQEGTSAQNWNVGDTFANYPTAAFLSGLVQEVDVQQQTGNYAADSGSTNAGAVALTPVPASLASLLGSPIRVKKVASANTGAYTLNVNALGAVPVVLPGGAGLVANALLSGGIFTVLYDGVSFELQSSPGVIGISGTAGGDLTGSYPDPTIAADVVTNGKLALMAAGTVKMNDTGGAANPQDVPASTLLAGLITAAYLTPANLGFVDSLASPGYIKLPGGLVIQWGPTGSVPSHTPTAIAFPLSYPTACFGVLLTRTSTDSLNSGPDVILGTATNDFTMENSAANPLTFFYISVGH